MDEKYLIIPKLDQSKVYEEVIKSLMDNQFIVIFPEGGSHDRTELLPLKPGACIFAWEAKKKLDKDVKLIPVSINYYGAHKFRSRVVIKIGKELPYEIDQKRINESSYKREFIGKTLKELKNAIEDIKLTAPSYRDLKNLYHAKEIYLPDDKDISPE